MEEEKTDLEISEDENADLRQEITDLNREIQGLKSEIHKLQVKQDVLLKGLNDIMELLESRKD